LEAKLDEVYRDLSERFRIKGKHAEETDVSFA